MVFPPFLWKVATRTYFTYTKGFLIIFLGDTYHTAKVNARSRDIIHPLFLLCQETTGMIFVSTQIA
jgi:hypothetical protein